VISSGLGTSSTTTEKRAESPCRERKDERERAAETDRSRQKPTETDRNRQKPTETDERTAAVQRLSDEGGRPLKTSKIIPRKEKEKEKN
jgi:hypothetical protein